MIALVWAQSANGVIGADGAMPWNLPEDLAHFRELTTGGTVVMGRRTWESLPERFRPLPGRHNVVVTRDPAYDAPGATVVHSLADALAAGEDVWVIGGAEIYAATIDRADAVYVTDIEADLPGDTYAPPVGAEWHVVSTDPETDWHTSSGGLRYRWRQLARADR